MQAVIRKRAKPREREALFALLRLLTIVLTLYIT
jgi:hypothetical protein